MNEIANEIGEDEHSERLDVWIDGLHAGSLSVDRTQKTTAVRTNLGPGFHTYELRGKSSMKDGRHLTIAGSGTIARAADVQERMAAARDLVSAARVFEALPGVTIEVERVTSDDLAAAEARLGLELPRAYRAEVLAAGAFVVRRGEEVLATLYHPRELLSPWDWMARCWGSPNREEMAVLKRDVCFADIGGPMVFFYGESQRCPDGQPSFEHGFLDSVEMRETGTDPWKMYIYPGPGLCDWRGMMCEMLHTALSDALTSEALAIASNGWNVYRTYEQPEPEELRMYLLAW